MARQMWIAAVVAALLACASESPPPPAGVDLEGLLPEVSSLEGWLIAEGPISYTPDTLWEYLDGGAPRYLAYGLEQMLHVRFQLNQDPLSSVTADVYQMASELGAFGIYSSIRPQGVEKKPWGAEGYLSGTVAAAWRGSIFVHVAADDERPELIEVAEMLVTGICSAAPGSVASPAILEPLPPEGLVSGSERYEAADLLGHASLGGGVLATYEIDGRRGELFYSDLGDEAAAQEAVQAFRREKGRWAEITETASGFRFEHPGAETGTVRVIGGFVVGVQGGLPSDAQEDLLQKLTARLGH